MEYNDNYQAILAASQRANWRIEDIIGGDKRLDFTMPFMPESLAQAKLPFLSWEDQRTLNQIRGHGYLGIFGLVEEFILPFVLDHARTDLQNEDSRIGALLQFAAEEAKHIYLFRAFRDEFECGFGNTCELIGPAHEIARAILARPPLAVALVILHIEWMTQRHYVESVKADQRLDAQFKSLLKHHWMEEAQHARIDALVVSALARGASSKDIGAAVEEYLEIGLFLDAGLKQQVELDIASLIRATGKRFAKKQREELVAAQQKAMRWTFLGSGMTHRKFLETVESLSPAGRERIEQIAPHFC